MLLQQSTFQTPWVLLLSGTHVTGKETLATSLSHHLSAPWIKAEMAHNSARFGAQSQSRRLGTPYTRVFARIWWTKLDRLGILNAQTSDTPCLAVVSCYAMIPEARGAIREVMAQHGIRTVFAILQISEETLEGRILGAEDEDGELREEILRGKRADLEVLEREVQGLGDVIVVDERVDVDGALEGIKVGLRRYTGLDGEEFG